MDSNNHAQGNHLPNAPHDHNTGPVIICGMHRSGTSLLCRSLEAAGLFMGHAKEHNHEAVFFLALNEWLFEQFGASWDNPYNMRFVNDELENYLHAVINNVINGPSAASYTGEDPGHQDIFTDNNRVAWGWKDPRNTFTAAIWAARFPGAKLVHVCRNPLDVADSLRRRELETLERHKAQLVNATPEQLDGTLRFQQSPRLFHLEEGISLWEEYTSQALLLEKQFGANAIRVRYEDFLVNPVEELARIASFAGLAPDADQLRSATAAVDPNRRCAFTQDHKLLSLFNDIRNRDSLKLLGYDTLLQDSCNTAA